MLHRKLFLLILLAGLTAFSNNVRAQEQTKEQAKDQAWKSIELFRTTRAEVEKRFGKPAERSDKNKFQAVYKLEDYNLFVMYSHGCGAGKDSDYAIPPDTVILLEVYLYDQLPLSTANIDRDKFKKGFAEPNYYLENMDEGVTYIISDDEAWFYRINYSPKKEHYKLECSKQSDNKDCKTLRL